VEIIAQINSTVNGIVWTVMMFVLLGSGIVLTIATKGVQFRKLAFSFKEVLGKLFSKDQGVGTVKPFQALATALASTVGVGNIAGVATAIHLGGPGALLWLMVSGLLGMSTKFAEIAIALNYREPDAGGTMRGGAMYVLKNGLKMPWLGSIFALLTAVAGFGLGNMVQANSLAATLNKSFGIEAWVTGMVLAGLVAVVILGGIKRIAEVTQFLVPIMCVLYVGGTIVILFRNLSEVPGVVQLVIDSAFNGTAAMGGFAGATVKSAMSQGIKKGLFSNEAGLGSAPMVHASAVTDHPIRQATYGIFEVFIDSMVICTLTGLAVLTTGAWKTGEAGAAMSAEAFAIGLPGEWGHLAVTISVIAFAFSTLLGFSYYGETAITYLFGAKAALPYRLAWTGFVYIGAIFSLNLVWDIADTLNGLMALPNLIGVLGSLGLLLKLMKEFFDKEKAKG
jgi:alanine or glycine:cation symporter, AGCS family